MQEQLPRSSDPRVSPLQPRLSVPDSTPTFAKGLAQDVTLQCRVVISSVVCPAHQCTGKYLNKNLGRCEGGDKEETRTYSTLSPQVAGEGTLCSL
jgi:hypothetical protein